MKLKRLSRLNSVIERNGKIYFTKGKHAGSNLDQIDDRDFLQRFTSKSLPDHVRKQIVDRVALLEAVEAYNDIAAQ